MGNDEGFYNPIQSMTLSILSIFSGTISAMCSMAVFSIVIKSREKKLKHPYHRMVFIMAINDCLCSINAAISTFLVPKNTPGVWMASGTITSCEVSGFILNMTTTTTLYMALLTLYYVLVIRFNMSETMLAGRVEPVIHGFAIGYPIITGSFAWSNNLLNPLEIQTGFCYLNEYPFGCNRSDIVDCTRGAKSAHISFLTEEIPVSIAFGLVVVNMTLIVLDVRKQELRMRVRYHSAQDSFSRYHEALIQATCYVLAFCVTYIGPAGIIISSKICNNHEKHRSAYFVWACISKFFFPLQGLWNLIIYVRPRYRSVARRNDALSSWQIFTIIFSAGSTGGENGALFDGDGRGRSARDFLPELPSSNAFSLPSRREEETDSDFKRNSSELVPAPLDRIIEEEGIQEEEEEEEKVAEIAEA